MKLDEGASRSQIMNLGFSSGRYFVTYFTAGEDTQTVLRPFANADASDAIRVTLSPGPSLDMRFGEVDGRAVLNWSAVSTAEADDLASPVTSPVLVANPECALG